MLPERGPTGNFARSVFFEDENDLDIYIEDTAIGSEKIASKIFSRVFASKYKVSQVFPLGGRGAVISKFNEEKARITRPSLFVIDGDIYHLTGDSIKVERGLYRFPFYCIENLMMDPDALHNILDEEDATRSDVDLVTAFDFTGWHNANAAKLKTLFIEYAVSRALNPSEPTIAYDVKNLVSGNKGTLDDNKLTSRIDDLRSKSIAKAGIENYEVARNLVINQCTQSDLEDLDYVSGKDYLFPLLKTRLRSIVRTNVTDLNLRTRLAKTCSVAKIMTCRDYVLGVDIQNHDCGNITAQA